MGSKTRCNTQLPSLGTVGPLESITLDIQIDSLSLVRWGFGQLTNAV